MDQEDTLIDALVEAGLVSRGERPQIEALTGGVSCDVYRADIADGPVCIKRALSALRVADKWEAPVERSHNEVLWLRLAKSIGIQVPEVIAELPERNLFVMSFYAPEAHPLWKAQLAGGTVDPAFASAVGEALVRVHGATANSAEVAHDFANDEMFHALRIEPYLLHTARGHPDLSQRITSLAEQVAATKKALVHGDVSPKNILVGSAGPIFLDAECAWYGEPAFDLAFCLTHLLLKSVWRPQWTNRYDQCFEALADSYLASVDWEPRADLEARAAALVSAFLLARVDGKSPVEYLTSDNDRAFVREAARSFLQQTPVTLSQLATDWKHRIGNR